MPHYFKLDNMIFHLNSFVYSARNRSSSRAARCSKYFESLKQMSWSKFNLTNINAPIIIVSDLFWKVDLNFDFHWLLIFLKIVARCKEREAILKCTNANPIQHFILSSNNSTRVVKPLRRISFHSLLTCHLTDIIQFSHYLIPEFIVECLNTLSNQFISLLP